MSIRLGDSVISEIKYCGPDGTVVDISTVVMEGETLFEKET